MAPLILAAGGKYRGVEHVRDVANEANQNIWSTRALWTLPNEKSTDLFKISPVNMLESATWMKEGYFDLIICKNVLHFYSPASVKEIIGRMNTWLKVGGQVFVTADSFFKEKYLADFYQKNQGREFPGYCIKNEAQSLYVYNFNGVLSRSDFKFDPPPSFDGPLILDIAENVFMEPARPHKGYLMANGFVDTEQMSAVVNVFKKGNTSQVAKAQRITSWSHIRS